MGVPIKAFKLLKNLQGLPTALCVRLGYSPAEKDPQHLAFLSQPLRPAASSCWVLGPDRAFFIAPSSFCLECQLLPRPSALSLLCLPKLECLLTAHSITPCVFLLAHSLWQKSTDLGGLGPTFRSHRFCGSGIPMQLSSVVLIWGLSWA